MKVKVIKRCFDKESRKIMLYGDIMEVSDERYKELSNFVKKENEEQRIKKKQD